MNYERTFVNIELRIMNFFVTLHLKPYETMRKRLITVIFLALLSPLTMIAQKVVPKAYYIDKNGFQQETTSIDGENGEAPLSVEFRANPTDLGDYVPSFEWHFYKNETDGKQTELFVRYEENTQYTFVDSGTFSIMLKVSFKSADGTVSRDSASVSVTIAESKLIFPNAFSPNDDGVNDEYGAKEYRSIVSFRAIIFNRWGQKLYEWDDPAGSWNGKYNGKDVGDGVYFVLVKAKGADGTNYNIRKDVNLLRGNAGGSTETTGEK